MKTLGAALVLATITLASARAATVEIYAAGSLRIVVESLIKDGAPAGLAVKPTFAGSGMLRERIEGGEKPDLFLSADTGSPQKLAQAGRTIVPMVPFARNRMCLFTRQSLGVTPENLIDRMLAKETRLKTSTPVADPAGDYAMMIFDRIDAQRPGTGRILRDKAQSLASLSLSAPAAPGSSPLGTLFRDNKIDMMIAYCSGSASLQKEVPDVASVPFPPALEPGPVYGMAVLSANPDALRLALYLLSDKGQEIVKAAGLVPVL